MTEQERFEAWFSTRPDFKVLAGMFRNPFSRKANGSYESSVVRTAFDSWQAAIPQWISVDERLPDESGEYLVFLQDKYLAYQYIALWSCDSKEWSCGQSISKITYWKPLDPPPQVQP